MDVAFALSALGAVIALDYFWRHRVVVQFGVLKLDEAKGEIVSREIRQIPFRPDDSSFRFGLRFFKRSGRAFVARVVHILPSAPAKLGEQLMSGVELPDGRYKIESEELKCSGGAVRRLGFSQGDPLGDYEVHLYVNGRRRTVIRYQVVA